MSCMEYLFSTIRNRAYNIILYTANINKPNSPFYRHCDYGRCTLKKDIIKLTKITKCHISIIMIRSITTT